MPLIPWNDLIPKTTSICQLLLKKFRVTSCLLFFFLVGSSKRCKENRRKEKKKSFQSCQLQESKSGQQERCANEHWFDKNKKFKRFREGEGNLSRRTLFAAEFPMLAKTTTKKKKRKEKTTPYAPFQCPMSMPEEKKQLFHLFIRTANTQGGAQKDKTPQEQSNINKQNHASTIHPATTRRTSPNNALETQRLQESAQVLLLDFYNFVFE